MASTTGPCFSQTIQSTGSYPRARSRTNHRTRRTPYQYLSKKKASSRNSSTKLLPSSPTQPISSTHLPHHVSSSTLPTSTSQTILPLRSQYLFHNCPRPWPRPPINPRQTPKTPKALPPSSPAPPPSPNNPAPCAKATCASPLATQPFDSPTRCFCTTPRVNISSLLLLLVRAMEHYQDDGAEHRGTRSFLWRVRTTSKCRLLSWPG